MSHDVFGWTDEWTRARGLKSWSAEEIESTNTFAKNDESHAPSSPSIGKVSDPSLYFVRNQTAGRGRGTNVWVSADGALLSSWSYRLANSPQPILSPLVGLALHDALRRSFAGLALSLKAPNDVYSGDKKIAGLLIETVVTGHDVKVVVGLGLNVTARAPSVATSGAIGDTTHVHREEWLAFLDNLRAELGRALVAGQETTLRADVRARLRDALNGFPGLQDPVLQVDEHGQIQTARGFVHWHQL
jgi:BirA family transcriptional regulator, biotin operon repressor / biotin---[acetyl-CoA-carboxylase] ligase